MMLSNQDRELGSPDNEPEHFPSEKEKEAILDEKSSYLPPTPSESSPMPPPYSEPDSSHSRSASPQLQQGTSPSPSSPTASASHSPSPAPGRSIPHSNRRPSISRSRTTSFLNGCSGTPVCVGKMIYDMLPSSASASASSSSSSSNSDSSKGGMAALFLPGPVISRRTSSASSSSGDSEIKANQSQMASNAPLGLDPKIQMTPIGAGSSSPASSPPAALAVAESALRLMRLPTLSPSAIIPPQNGVSCLPTPEMEAEPEAMIIRATNTHTTIASASSSHVPALSSNVNHNQSTLISAPAPSSATSLALSHNPNDLAVNSTTIYDTDSRTMALSPPTARALYTGPPSPSLSDSYARAHPGEVEAKEVGLMPSLSSNTNNQMIGLSHQSLLESSTQLPHQTPPAASSTITIPLMQTPPQQHEPPTLVVVNPTPNPTPHPTPPATPLLHGTIGPGGLIRSQWLTLPEGAAGGGARQHQLLQAAQHQMQQMQASHHQVTALRLPPPVGVGVGLGVGAAVQVNASAHPGAGDIFGPDHVDRSRSVTRGFSEVSYGAAAASSTSTGSRGVVSSDLNYAHPVGLTAPDQQRPPVRDESRQGSLSLECDPKDDVPYLRQEQAPYQHQQPRDKVNRHSISSTTSSNHSHLSDRSSASGRAESTTTNTTVSSSEAENQHQERNSLQGCSAAERAAMFDAQQALVQKQHGSLSTIQSMSTLADRRKETGAGDVVHSRSTSAEDEEEEEGGSDEVGICVDGEAAEEDDAPLSPLPPPGGLAMSPRQEKRRKRNSAPPALLGLSPAASTGSGSGQPSAFTSSPKSASTTSAVGKRKVTPGAPMMRRANSVRSSSRSRSAGGSSVGKSRSRSREPGVVGLGGLGMTSAAAAPVAAVTARKPTTVGAGRGRAKVVLGRAGFKAKGGVIRRNSSGLGTAATAQAEALEQELQREQVENEHRDQLRAEALEKERQRNLHQAEDRRRVEEQALALVREKAAREERMRVEEEERREEERQRHREQIEALAGGVEAGGSKRPVRFNIGSNSDEGSGLGSKSVGSGSDVSGGLQGDGRGGSRVDELRVPLSSKAKGKEKQRDVDPRDMVQQLHQHLQQHQEQQQQQSETKDQLNLQQHLQRQMSKQQLHQLQKMQQLHQQHQNQTTIHQHQPQQYQQQFQHQQQLLQLGQANQFPPTSRQASSKQLDLGGGREDERVSEQQKGKEREVVSVQPPPKPTKSTSKVNVALDDDLAAKVKQSLAAPLLPQNRRTIVLATSESDFETDSEDEGSWSSEEMTGDESVVRNVRVRNNYGSWKWSDSKNYCNNSTNSSRSCSSANVSSNISKTKCSSSSNPQSPLPVSSVLSRATIPLQTMVAEAGRSRGRNSSRTDKPR
ncbi:hypothetical protein GALMADRAFT_1034755 [Galerina marginata CBS 339.88]|uniref:Uncharacterized protein n=1 Tax=Galerina marginata (strain CBS 339.88) TaxID=685588 RepID=A0A067SP51_GALM3|nr:hypothetical protein GALMADRAFT_1034755 [Galerina marginata CBS 339.88]